MDLIIFVLGGLLGLSIGFCIGILITYYSIKKKGIDQVTQMIDEAAGKIEEHGQRKTEI
jgi:ABC-type nitrate/sulfonate/bicarbonate transport system permease component